MNNDDIEWTVDYFKNLNKRLEAVGLPTVIVDEENKMVYKDVVHKALGLGVHLEGQETSLLNFCVVFTMGIIGNY